MRETNGNFDSCNSCKRLVPSRLHELREPKFPFVSRIEFIRSKLSNFSAHVYGVYVRPSGPLTTGRVLKAEPAASPSGAHACNVSPTPANFGQRWQTANGL